MTRVLVIGAGIGGLTTALSLHAAGIECVVVDKAREVTAAGVGINLQPHAVRELTELGLGEEMAALGVPTSELVHYDRFGNRIWGEPRGIAAGYRWPQYSIHRGALQMMLLRAVRERLGADVVDTGVAFDSCTETSGGVHARLRVRGSDELVEEDFDALVGADGPHSAVRAQHYADWRFDWLDVPELIRSSETILEYPMVDRDPLARWGTGRITLLGDAAHPMYPIGSNGGSQAILDARVLAYYLATTPDVPMALAGYELERREPANAIVLANRSLGPERVLRMVAERAPNGFTRVEDVLSAQELATIGDAYRSTTSTDVAALNTRASWNPNDARTVAIS